MKQYNHGLVALSADPIHNGHIELIKAAKELSKKVYVFVSDNDEKKNNYLFSLKDRQNFARRAIKGIDGVEVIESPTNILSDTYLLFDCDALFRGIRDDKDQAYESTQMSYHKLVCPNLNPIYLPFRKEGAISSTVVKAFTRHHIDVSQYVPMFIKQALEERICKQYKIAVTGGMAVGKSWVVDNLVKICNEKLVEKYYNKKSRRNLFGDEEYAYVVDNDIPAFKAKSINFDNLIREVYNDPMPGPLAMRKEIDRLFKLQGWPESVLNHDETINRQVLAKRMFAKDTSNEFRLKIHQLTQPFVDARYRSALKLAGEGLIIVEWAQLAEMNLGHLTNNNVIVVDAPDRARFCESRKISCSDFEERSRFQWSAQEKVRAILKAGDKDGQANVITFSNTIKDNKINELAEEVLSFFGV